MMLSARLLLVGLLALAAAKEAKEGSSKSGELDKLKRENAELKKELAALKSEAGSGEGSGTCILPDEMATCTVHGVPYLCGRMLGAWAQNHFIFSYLAEFTPKIQAAWEAAKKTGPAARKYVDLAYENFFVGVAHVVQKIAGAKKFDVTLYTKEGNDLLEQKTKPLKDQFNKILGASGGDKLSVSNAKDVGGKVVDFVFNKMAAEMEVPSVAGKKVKFGHGIIDIVLALIQAAAVGFGGFKVGMVVFKWGMKIGWAGFKMNFWIFTTTLKQFVCPAVTVSLLFIYGFVGVTAMHIVADKKAGIKIGAFALDNIRDRLLLGWAAGAAMWVLLVLIMFKICGCYVLFPCCCKSRAKPSNDVTNKNGASNGAKPTGKAKPTPKAPASGKNKAAPSKK